MSLLKECKSIFFNSSINCSTSFSVSSSFKKQPARMKSSSMEPAGNTWGMEQQRGLSWLGTAKIPGDSLQDCWNGNCMSHAGENTGHSKWPKSNLSYPSMHWNKVTDSSEVFIHTLGVLLSSKQPKRQTSTSIWKILPTWYFSFTSKFFTHFFFNTRIRKTLFIKRDFPEVSNVEHWRKKSSGKMINSFEKLTWPLQILILLPFLWNAVHELMEAEIAKIK